MDLCCRHRIFTFAALGLSVLPPQLFLVALAKTFAVGDSRGWVVGAVNYTEWAAKYTFHAGDTLTFNYLKQYHTVLEVTKDSYTTCNSNNAIATYDDGYTVVTLQNAGTYYYICGVTGHCPAGQKVEVIALAKSGAEAPAPLEAAVPIEGRTPPESGEIAPGSTSSKVPKNNNAAATSNAFSHHKMSIGRNTIVMMLPLLQLLQQCMYCISA